MLHVITSNPIGIKHLNQYANNFILVHTTSRILIPSMNLQTYCLDIYHQEDMDLSEYDDYEDDTQFQYRFINGIQPSTIIESIAESIFTEDQKAKATDSEDNPEEHMVAFACDYEWNQSAVKRFNGWMKDHGSDINAVNLFTALKVPSKEKLTDYVKMALSTEFVYPDDPVAFGYALYQVLSGIVR